MSTERHTLTDADVWTFATEGCNAAEIAAYAGVSEMTANNWMLRAWATAGADTTRAAA